MKLLTSAGPFLVPLFLASPTSLLLAEEGGNMEDSDLIGCVKSGYAEGEEIVLDWEKIGSLGELDKCILLIAKKMPNYQEMINWMNRNGYSAKKLSTYPANTMRSLHGYNGEGVLISGVIRRDDLNIGVNPLSLIGVHNLSTGVLFRQDQVPVRSRSAFTRK